MIQLETLKNYIRKGWAPVDYTLLYVDATSVKIAGDVSSFFWAGQKIQFTQSSTIKRAMIGAVAYASSYTTLTLAMASGATVANSAITLPFVSSFGRPESFPEQMECHALTLSTAQVIANATAIPLDTEKYDPFALHDNTTNNTRITIKVPGYYQVIGALRFQDSSAGSYRGGVLLKSGTAFTVNSGSDKQQFTTKDGSNRASITMEGVEQFTAGQYIEIAPLHDMGGIATINWATLSARWIS